MIRNYRVYYACNCGICRQGGICQWRGYSIRALTEEEATHKATHTEVEELDDDDD